MFSWAQTLFKWCTSQLVLQRLEWRWWQSRWGLVISWLCPRLTTQYCSRMTLLWGSSKERLRKTFKASRFGTGWWDWCTALTWRYVLLLYLNSSEATVECFQEVDVHGRIYTDSEFGSLQLSENKKSLYYIAEKKKEKNVPFLSQAPLNADAQIGGEYK